jgi:hypothetical protein
MSTLQQYLSPIDLKIDQLLLDPNNPRFAELGESDNDVPESRIAEERVQDTTYERMKSKRFDVAELRDTIKTVGFLPMDRIVVREWGTAKRVDEKKYIVIEGNRRVTALMWLLELHEDARETLTVEQIKNYTYIPALLLDEKKAPKEVRFILAGLRHVSGVKEWGPYQRAKAVHMLREAGESTKEVAQSLGLSTQQANLLWRSYSSLEQMRRDEEFGEFSDPRKYSYFEEIHKRPNVRTWLGWSDDEQIFTNEEAIKEMYGWIIGELVEGDDLENRSEPKLPEAKSVRDLARIIDVPVALAVFRMPEGSLTRALAKLESEHKELWQGSIINTQSTLESITTDTLRSMTSEDVTLLNELIERINQVLADREKLLS